MKHLSRFDIEAIADKYVQAYMALPDVRNTQIYRIDPELLLEKVLGLNVEYQHLSYDGSILGMTSFTEMGVQVFEDDDNEAFFFLDGKTVLVEKDLNFDSKLKGRKNFTLMHRSLRNSSTMQKVSKMWRKEKLLQCPSLKLRLNFLTQWQRFKKRAKLKKKSLLRTVQMRTLLCSQNCYQIRKQQHY